MDDLADGNFTVDKTEIRSLDESDLAGAAAIDVSEDGDVVYVIVDGELRTTNESWSRPRRNAAAWAELIRGCRVNLRPDVWLGAFQRERMVGLASLRHRLRGTTAQLTTLHVDRAHRRRGVAGRLLQEAVELAREEGATHLYVSATPSASAVGFYLRHGFEPTEPDPRLLALEPEDIHMLRTLSRAVGSAP